MSSLIILIGALLIVIIILTIKLASNTYRLKALEVKAKPLEDYFATHRFLRELVHLESDDRKHAVKDVLIAIKKVEDKSIKSIDLMRDDIKIFKEHMLKSFLSSND